jgi:hypothetical protein
MRFQNKKGNAFWVSDTLFPDVGWLEVESPQFIDFIECKKTRNVTLLVIMPSINLERARQSMSLLVRRSGISAQFLIYLDVNRSGFVNVVNSVSCALQPQYIVYLAEDAFPGTDWLKIAFDNIRYQKGAVFAFNDGKWAGHLASFGLVDCQWSGQFYGGNNVFFPGYHSHYCDTELTWLAKKHNKYCYDPRSVLIEVDYKEIHKEHNPGDILLYRSRAVRFQGSNIPLQNDAKQRKVKIF